MLNPAFYNSAVWRRLSARAISRDGSRCTVARLLGGRCHGPLHAHHIERPADADDPLAVDLDNLGTACASHHPRWEALRRALERARRRDRPRCPHRHVHREARRQCEERLARSA